MRKTFLVGFALLFIVWTRPTVAQWVPVSEKEGFGQSVGASGNTVFVGDPDNTYRPGRVFVYEEGEPGAWSHRTYLQAKDGQLDDRFGSALDVDDGTLAVGAPAVNAVYVFQQQGADGVWTQVDQVEPSKGPSDFGRSVEIDGNRLFVAASTPSPSAEERSEEESDEGSAGVVYVFEGQGGTDWQQNTVLENDELAADNGFGAALLARGDQLVVGAPRHQSGAVTFYRRNDTGWTKTQTLTVSALAENAGFGAVLRWGGDQVLVGAPQANDATGAVYSLTSAENKWTVASQLVPFDGSSNDAFGTSLAYTDNTLWVGAPDAERETGALYRYRRSDGSWSTASRVSPPEPEERNRFGAAIGATSTTVAVGLPGDNYGGGTMALYSTTEEAWTAESPIVPPTGDAYSAITGGERSCTDGQVEQFSCKNVDLKAFMPVSAVGGKGGVELSDVWGWTDPQTGTEYALVGRADGTAFVDVSTPTNPVYVGELPMTEGSHANSWRDIKVYEDHAFIVADNVGDHGMQVFDLSELRDVDPSEMPVTFEASALYDRINSAHNVAINKETGYAYIVGGSGGGQTCGGGLHMVNIQDPLNPTFEGCFGGEGGAGSGGTGSTHDAQCILYEGPDQEHQGREICVGYNETEIAVVDVTDKSTPELISTASYPNFGYVHQGWFTDNQRYMYSNDEGDEIAENVQRTRTIVWDMSDLDNPVVANQFLLSNPSSDHNLYVKGDKMYQSNYKSGLRVLDISNPEKPKEIGHFDLFPPSDTPGFEGTWSNYPYFESGIIVTATYDGGFFVLEYSEPEL